MTSRNSSNDKDQRNSIEWRLYTNMLTTRLFEEALVRWEHEGKHSAQLFRARGRKRLRWELAWRWKKATMSFRLFEPAVR